MPTETSVFCYPVIHIEVYCTAVHASSVDM